MPRKLMARRGSVAHRALGCAWSTSHSTRMCAAPERARVDDPWDIDDRRGKAHDCARYCRSGRANAHAPTLRSACHQLPIDLDRDA